jgi:hypothetical protein
MRCEIQGTAYLYDSGSQWCRERVRIKSSHRCLDKVPSWISTFAGRFLQPVPTSGSASNERTFGHLAPASCNRI